jgi:hypothetical protein
MEGPINPYEGLNEEQIRRYEEAVAEKEAMPPTEKRDYKETAEVLDKALTYVEKDFKFKELHAITKITFEESRKHPIREPARQSLISLNAYLRFLKEETNVPEDIYDGLRKRYKLLDQAVGMLNLKDGLVDHTRQA